MVRSLAMGRSWVSWFQSSAMPVKAVLSERSFTPRVSPLREKHDFISKWKSYEQLIISLISDEATDSFKRLSAKTVLLWTEHMWSHCASRGTWGFFENSIFTKQQNLKLFHADLDKMIAKSWPKGQHLSTPCPLTWDLWVPSSKPVNSVIVLVYLWFICGGKKSQSPQLPRSLAKGGNIEISSLEVK